MIPLLLVLHPSCSSELGPYDWAWYGDGALELTLTSTTDRDLDATLTVAGVGRDALEAFHGHVSEGSRFTAYSDGNPVADEAELGRFSSAVGSSPNGIADDEVWVAAWADVAGTAWEQTACGAPVTGIWFEGRASVGVTYLALISVGEGVGEPGAATAPFEPEFHGSAPNDGSLSLGRVTLSGPGTDCGTSPPPAADVTVTWAYADDPVIEERGGGGPW